ncbi:MAG TPA: pantoate--beta-alanine ligase [candidate division Zixibacteria bacterium]|nr:pantoate--beta-alanine ligase [candidate division Zixibacteria bacterium]MDD4916372.1 pantoate--beta-alanine ligase [candidate division Zixibacteria bacterium]MDM7972832.1 pantoate--beta-alanine ligase [candidate division Zixibacteria bacterium]HOD66608.1 pantoate--beta-alanine ligase [candidate division Zixibacteria bacterium]HOZ08476.1 pantoate--beta-alanine ligase [candidate division Zixibacteria bacterium]
MRIIRSIRQMQRAAREAAAAGKTIGVVPTMGYLHEGHLALVRRAKKAADLVVVTIFVNPAQFAPGEDFARYPRDEKGDVKKIRSAGGDLVFIPSAADMYPPGFQTYVTVGGVTEALEGAVRPGHFLGVATVVAKLFNIVRPDVAVFGMKDYQQAVVLRQVARDLDYPIRMVIAPTVRESDGLAMSSRNAYFKEPQHRAEARCLYYALRTARAMAKAGAVDPKKIRAEMEKVIHGACPSAEIDYIAFTDLWSVQPAAAVRPGVVCSLAVRVHGVRLIDNMRM